MFTIMSGGDAMLRRARAWHIASIEIHLPGSLWNTYTLKLYGLHDSWRTQCGRSDCAHRRIVQITRTHHYHSADKERVSVTTRTAVRND